VFCPNCGTENDEAATTCKKCGFNLKGAAAPKFKGTMLMMNSPQQGMPRPGAPAPGPAAPPPAAPPPAAAPPAAAPPPGAGSAGRPHLKGTMLGVAPPSLGAHGPPPGAAPAGPPNAANAQQFAPTPAQAFGAPPAPTPQPAAPAPGVNPLGGTMVADPAGMGFSPYGAQPAPGGYGPPPGPAPAPQQGYGAPPQGFGGPPPGQQPGFPPPGGGYPPPGGGYPPQGGGYGAPPQQPQGGYGAPPPQGPPPGGGYGPPPGQPGGYGAPPQGFGAPQPGYGAPGPGGMPPGAAPIVASAGGRPIGKTRNPVMTLVFSMLCFVYAIIQVWQMTNELNAFRGKNDIKPILFFVPILGIIEMWKLVPKLLETKQMAGVPNASVQHPVLYLFFGIFFLPSDLNEIWQAAGGGQPR